jgi:hypothetical protein
MKNTKVIFFSVFLCPLGLFAGLSWEFLDSLNNRFSISQELVKNVKPQYNYLNESEFFKFQSRLNIKKNPVLIRKNFLEDKKERVSEFTVVTEDAYKLSCLFFDRNSDVAVVLAPGLGGLKEHLALYTQIFKNVDLYLFEFRGHGIASWYDLRPWKKMFYLDTSCALGAEEEKDVFVVVDFVRKNKKYEKLVGFGSCFGAFVFAKAQAIKEKKRIPLFDKLILYNCWPSVGSIVKKFSHDPKLMVSSGREAGWNFCFLKYDFCEKLFCKMASNLFWVNVEKLALDEYLQDIKVVPTLFIHNDKDMLIKEDEFLKMFKELKAEQKFALIAPFAHNKAHIADKEFFAFACNSFISENSVDFMKNLQ